MSLFPGASRAAAAATTLLVAAAMMSAGPAAAQARNPLVPLAGAAPAPATAHRDGAVAGGRRIGVAVALKPHDEAGLNRFVASVGDPRSPAYRHYLSSADYNARFAPRASDVDQVTNYLRDQGFLITGVAGNRQVVDATGSAGAVEAAFGTSLGNYTGPGGAHFYANDTAASIPAGLTGIVRAVTGLSDRPVAHRAGPPVLRRKPAGAGPGGPGGGYTPAQFRTAYRMDELSGAYTGAGRRVGLIEFDAFEQSDLDGWTRNFDQPPVRPEVVPVDGGVPRPGRDQLEVTLDVEAVAATAPGAAQTVYEAPNRDDAWVDELAKIASDDSITVLSGSWLEGEKCGSPPIGASHDSYTQMAAQGITLLSASGDWGATGCGYDGDTSTVQADFPASDPLVTGVGGTQLRTGDGAGTYQAESCWSEGGSGPTRSGGGYSQIFAKPDWQPGDSRFRSVPDVALDADYGAGALSVYVNGGWQDAGGTSLSSPLWAGYVALVDQKAQSEGKNALGAMNPTLYSIAGSPRYSSTFHDVTTGGSGTHGAGTGYDLCTGWGSMQGDNLADPLINGAAPAPGPDFSVAPPAPVGVEPGESVTTVIPTAVIRGSAQDVTLAAAGLPSGVTASFEPATVTAGRSSTLTLTAAATAPPGTTPVTVTGKGTDASHTATVALTVDRADQGEFSLAVSPAPGPADAGQPAQTTVKAVAITGARDATPEAAGSSPSTVDESPPETSTHGKDDPGDKRSARGRADLEESGSWSGNQDSWAEPDCARHRRSGDSRASTHSGASEAHRGPTDPAGEISLTASGLPAGAAAQFGPASIGIGDFSSLTVATSPSTPAGDYPITVTGKSADKTGTVTFVLEVRKGGPGPSPGKSGSGSSPPSGSADRRAADSGGSHPPVPREGIFGRLRVRAR